MAHLDPQGRLVIAHGVEPLAIEAFYLADRQDDHRIDDLVAFWSGLFHCNWNTPPTSHEERGYLIDGEPWFFSATSRNELGSGQKHGTRWIKAEDLLRNPGRWTFLINRQIQTHEIHNEIRLANTMIGWPYDFIGVFVDFTSPVDPVKQKESIYCSKACHRLEYNEFRRISPRRRWKKLLKTGRYYEATMEDIKRIITEVQSKGLPA